MKLSQTNQATKSEVRSLEFDAFVAASGYETRATYLLSQIDVHRVPKKLAFGFSDRVNSQREENDRLFHRAGVETVRADGDSGDLVRECISRLLEESCGNPLRLLVDYSSMTRTWYSAIIEGIGQAEINRRIECFFSYSPATFSEPPESSPNAFVGPISRLCSLEVPDKPSALVIGLGYEKERALGLVEYVDPAVTYVFYADPALDSRFLDAVLRNNAALLSVTPRKQIIAHPLLDLQRTVDLLVSLWSGLQEEYRVILAPLGLKPFSLFCLLLGAVHANVDVWRVTGGTKSLVHDRKPSGDLLILRTVFEPGDS